MGAMTGQGGLIMCVLISVHITTELAGIPIEAKSSVSDLYEI